MNKVFFLTALLASYSIKNTVYSQDTIYNSIKLGTEAYKNVCVGDTITFEFKSSQSMYPYDLSFLNSFSSAVGCGSLVCIKTEEVFPTISGDGIIKVETFRGHRLSTNQDCGSNVGDPYIKIQMKPTANTTFKIYWQTVNISDSIPVSQCWWKGLRRITRITSFSASCEIRVINPQSPTLLPINTYVNTNSIVKIDASYNFQTSSRKIAWYQVNCETEDIKGTIQYGASSPAPYSYSITPKTAGSITYKAKAIDSGCASEFSSPLIINVKPCGLTTTGCNKGTVDFIENNSCNSIAMSRTDHHFYHLETSLCKGNNCNLEEYWRNYKSQVNHQVPILLDETLFLGRQLGTSFNIGWSYLLFPHSDLYEPIRDCAKVSLPRIATYAIWLQDVASILQKCSKNPYSFSDPVFLRVDESLKCITNYTLPDHIFYPGKVTRCLVKECDEIKILTFGEGTTSYHDDQCGKLLAWLNKFGGESIFKNVNYRTVNDLNPKDPDYTERKNSNKDENTSSNSYSINASLINKNWQVKDYKIQHSGDNLFTTVYSFNDSTNFWNMRNLNVNFLNNGKYNGKDVVGDLFIGTWDYDSVRGKLTIDSVEVEVDIDNVSNNEFTIHGITPIYNDTVLTTAKYSMTFYQKDFEVTTYTFTGNGNWNDSTKWSNKTVPPIYIPYGAEVIINPTGTGQCILDSEVTVAKGGKLTVKPGKIFKVNGNLKVN